MMQSYECFPERDNSTFDAFVSYRSCTPDEHFVLDKLRPKLEEEFGFQLCIHLRDFEAGAG